MRDSIPAQVINRRTMRNTSAAASAWISRLTVWYDVVSCDSWLLNQYVIISTGRIGPIHPRSEFEPEDSAKICFVSSKRNPVCITGEYAQRNTIRATAAAN